MSLYDRVARTEGAILDRLDRKPRRPRTPQPRSPRAIAPPREPVIEPELIVDAEQRQTRRNRQRKLKPMGDLN